MNLFLEGSTPVSIWGAVLSTVLAAIKVWEFWKARIQIEVSYNFTSDQHIGNDVIIRNLGGSPLIITYWELVWRKRKLLGWKQSYVIDPEEDIEDIKIGSHSSMKLSFQEARYFSTSPSALAGRKIFLRLNIAGQSRAVTKKIYG